jgi:transcriptional regulator with XRE-family HTH domain
MTRTPHRAFPAWLRGQLRDRGLSVVDFAARVGVRPAAVYRWTAGQRAPVDDQSARIADALALDPADVWAVLAKDGVAPIARPGLPRPIPPASERPPPSERPFARWLRSTLAERRWTAAQLARALDVDRVTLRRWAGGLQTPASVQVAGLAAALGVDVATIRDALEGTSPPESP